MTSAPPYTPQANKTFRQSCKLATRLNDFCFSILANYHGIGSRYVDCADEENCSSEDWLLVIKLGVLAAVLMVIFFVFTQCTRYAVHFSFCINTKGERTSWIQGITCYATQ